MAGLHIFGTNLRSWAAWASIKTQHDDILCTMLWPTCREKMLSEGMVRVREAPLRYGGHKTSLERSMERRRSLAWLAKTLRVNASRPQERERIQLSSALWSRGVWEYVQSYCLMFGHNVKPHGRSYAWGCRLGLPYGHGGWVIYRCEKQAVGT